MEDGLCSLSEVLSRRDRIMRDALAHGQRFSEVIAFCHFKWSDVGAVLVSTIGKRLDFSSVFVGVSCTSMSNYLRLVLILWWDGNSA